MDWDQHHIDGGRSTPAPVTIGNNVWIGTGAIILKDVTIGNGAVVAAGSLVDKDVSPRVLVAELPARMIRHVAWV